MTRRTLLLSCGLVLLLATSTAWLPGSAAPTGDRDNVAGEEDEGPGAGPAGSDQWFAAQRLYPFTSAGQLASGYRAAQDQAVRAATAPRAAGLAAAAWQPLGPANVGGRVTDLVVDPGLGESDRSMLEAAGVKVHLAPLPSEANGSSRANGTRTEA